ncbi:BTB/POZ domain-containing protein [Hibiscus syriacus]|uniref:BTB/POZ domain-containing protein n=1 Tax=Hibiscus syriacus TaxID=106335 RepID=A0A6A3AF48_HIBSY|nr:BTB/POZ domain-containing protein [Hibiscus syriacus]
MATKFDIEKFNGRNFSLWKLKMKAILRKDGCLLAISERPVDFTDDNKWIEMDGNAMANFHLALAYEVLSSIEEKKTAKEIWDHLTKLYEATSLHNKIFLKRKLYTLRMSESTSVKEHLNTLNTLFSQLTSLSCKIGEQERAELLLQSLLDSYDQLIINLTNSNVTSLVFDGVAAAVLQEENRHKNKEDRQKNLQQAEALTTMTTMRGRSTERGQRSSHKHCRSKSRSKKNLKCYNYGKKGGSVYSCNDHALEIVGVRTIKLKMYDGTIKVIRDVRHVEGLKKNLLSYGLLDNNASKIETRKGIMKVFRGALVVLKGEKIAANLYMLKGETLLEAEASVASCSSDSAMLWHKKLGHMSEQGMKVLVEQKLLPGLTKVSLTLCEHCITSKQHQLKFNTSKSRGKNVLELVHSDVWQAPITSLGGAKYFVSFIDDYSRRCWVYPIKKKSCVFSTFKNFKAKEDIKRQFTVANTPQQNGVAERMNRTLLERTRAMLRDAGLEKSFWAEAVNTTCYLVNRAPSTTIELKTPMEMWTRKPADYSNLHVFGNPTARKVIISRDVIFVEDKLQRKEDDDSAEKSETTHIHVENEVEQGDSYEAEPAHDEQEPESSEAPTTRQSDRVRRHPNWHSDYVIEGNITYCLLTEDGEPSTYQETINSSDASLWMMAMQEEIEAHHKNNTWDLVPLPQGRKPIGNKWVFKIKRNGDDQVERYRARLVVKGYAQKEEQLDVKTAFLHGNLEEEIYMLQPEGFEEKEKKNLVYRLNKSLYGLKQVRGVGIRDLIPSLCALDTTDLMQTLVLISRELKAQLAMEFEMKDLGSANKILGMQIHRDRSNRKIWLSQKNYLKKILSRFSMQDCKPISTPLPINFKLSSSMTPSSEDERMEMSRVPYASAVRSLMFDMICTRPDIAQAVGVVSRYMANPGKEHWNTLKRILRYIKGTSNVALCYGGSNLLINGYVDSDYARDLDKSKSTTGYVFKITGGAVSWVLKLQSIVATSTTEAEYVAATQASKEVIWLKILLEELGHNQEYVSLFCDSQSALHLARNLTFHSRTKHIRVQYHFIREKVEEGTVDMQKIHTKDNIADFMMKAINADKFTLCRSSCDLLETIFSDVAGDITIAVDGESFLLHKFPLVSRSGKIRKMVANGKDYNVSKLELVKFPGGPQTFELAMKFCYGLNFEITTANAALLCCAAEYLEMTEDYREENLIARTEVYLNEVVVHSLDKCVEVLCTCETLHPMAEELGITDRCVDAILMNACKEQLVSGLSGLDCAGESTELKSGCLEWWIEDLSVLRIDYYHKVIIAMGRIGVRPDSIVESLMHYAQASLKGIGKCQILNPVRTKPISATAENEQRTIVETIVSLLLAVKSSSIPLSFLFGMLRMAIMVEANVACRLELERRIAFRLEMVSLDDLLIPSLSAGDSLFDVDTVHRILINFLQQIEDEENEDCGGYESDGLASLKFIAMIEILPDYARVIDDGLYRAIDIYLKAHPMLSDHECKKLCRVIDCQKLSQEASNHAAQNERLPVQMAVRVLYFEQLRLKNALCTSSGDGLLSQKISSGVPSAAMSPRDNYASLRGKTEN